MRTRPPVRNPSGVTIPTPATDSTRPRSRGGASPVFQLASHTDSSIFLSLRNIAQITNETSMQRQKSKSKGKPVSQATTFRRRRSIITSTYLLKAPASEAEALAPLASAVPISPLIGCRPALRGEAPCSVRGS